jgi:Glycosyl transferase family 2
MGTLKLYSFEHPSILNLNTDAALRWFHRKTSSAFRAPESDTVLLQQLLCRRSRLHLVAPVQWSPLIAVPVRNEERRLPILLEALSKQSWIGHTARRLPVVLVLNNCADESLTAAIEARSKHPSLCLHITEIRFPARDAHVGSARRLAMEKAKAAASGLAHAVLITTDADAAPEPQWVEANLRAIGAGADIVGGLIIGDRAEEVRLGPKFLRRARNQARYAMLADRLAAMIDPLPHDSWPRHHDHIAASLAVRGEVYAAVGGLRSLRCREDLDFVRRVCAAGYRLRHSLDVRVQVSARLNGRASGGMAACLKRWVSAEAKGLPHLVEAPQAIAARARRRHMLRLLAAAPSERPMQYGPIWPGGALVELLAPDEPDAIGTVRVDLAAAQIEQMISELEGQALAA